MPRTAQRQREHAPIFRIFTAAIYNIAMIQQTEFTLRPRTRGFHLVTDEITANLPPLPEKLSIARKLVDDWLREE